MSLLPLLRALSMSLVKPLKGLELLLSTKVSLATCSYWILEMWFVQIEMCHKIHSKWQKLIKKKRMQNISLIFILIICWDDTILDVLGKIIQFHFKYFSNKIHLFLSLFWMWPLEYLKSHMQPVLYFYFRETV